jgi:hypothetical protein
MRLRDTSAWWRNTWTRFRSGYTRSLTQGDRADAERIRAGRTAVTSPVAGVFHSIETPKPILPAVRLTAASGPWREFDRVGNKHLDLPMCV